MARTIQEIKSAMTTDFMANETIRDIYGLTLESSFDEVFSPVSLESILFGIFATCVWALESLMDIHKLEVEKAIATAIVASEQWYYEQALKFQRGDALIFNPSTKGFGYLQEDKSKRIVKYVAIRDAGNSIKVLVSGETDGRPSKLSIADLTLFKEYMNRIKIAGIVLSIKSLDADVVRVYATVRVDPLVLNDKGERLDDKSTPVVDAINKYLQTITYGGVFNKTKLVDAVQQVPGVRDITLERVSYSIDGISFNDVNGNDYTARSGCFISDNLNQSIVYVV
jgi:hypothetical protein